MGNKPNAELREEMQARNIRQWQVAEALNMSESKLCRMMRHELPEEEQARIKKILRG